MLLYPAVTVEDSGALARDGVNAPALPADNTNIWTSQLLGRTTQPVLRDGGATASGVTESVPTRTAPTIQAPNAPNVYYAPHIITTTAPDTGSGVTINPNPADATQTPTAINQIDGSRLPASTTSVLQGRPTVTPPGALPKLTRNEIIALVVLAALVIL